MEDVDGVGCKAVGEYFVNGKFVSSKITPREIQM
jgi:hypothetical protein